MVYGGFNKTERKEFVEEVKDLQLNLRPFDGRMPKFNDPGPKELRVNIKRSIEPLRVEFTGNTDRIDPAGAADAMRQVGQLARALISDPSVNLTLIGNGGLNNPTNAPVNILSPNDPRVRGQIFQLNGRPATAQQINQDRANAIRAILINSFGIPQNRIKTAPGSTYNDPIGRMVESRFN
jgi:hypothetical protein